MSAPQANEPDAMDLLMEVVGTASRAREEGWTVNVAIDTGGDEERLTFSASRVLKDSSAEGAR